MADWTLVGHISPPQQVFGPGSSTLIEVSRLVWRRLAHLLVMTGFMREGLEDVLTTSELAEYLKVSRQAIYDLRHSGRGPRGVHIGKELRYRVSDINEWLEHRSDPLPRGTFGAR